MPHFEGAGGGDGLTTVYAPVSVSVAPSAYLAKLIKGDSTTPPISPTKLDDYLRSHLAEPAKLHGDDFAGFMEDRQRQLLGLIEQAMGKAAYGGASVEEDEDVETREAEMTISA